VKAQHTLGDFTLGRINPEVIPNVNTPDNQHLAIQLDLAGCF